MHCACVVPVRKVSRLICMDDQSVSKPVISHILSVFSDSCLQSSTRFSKICFVAFSALSSLGCSVFFHIDSTDVGQSECHDKLARSDVIVASRFVARGLECSAEKLLRAQF